LQKDKRLLALRMKDKILLVLIKITQLLEKIIQAPEKNNTSA
jgi:hypothetical protein